MVAATASSRTGRSLGIGLMLGWACLIIIGGGSCLALLELVVWSYENGQDHGG